MTPWLYHQLKNLGFPVIWMDARRAADALEARPEKTDKADAQALAEMLVFSGSCEDNGKQPTEGAVGSTRAAGQPEAPALRPDPRAFASVRHQDFGARRRQAV